MSEKKWPDVWKREKLIETLQVHVLIVKKIKYTTK